MTLRSRDKAALAVVGAVVVMLAFYLLIIAPVGQKASRLETQIAAQRQTLAQDESTYQSGRAAEAALRTNRAQWDALGRAVPPTADIPALLRLLQRNAAAEHVSVQAISLSGGSGTGPAVTPAPTSTAAGASAAGAQGVPVSLTFAGNYQGLERLISRLNRLVVISGRRVYASGPLMSISSVSLTGSDSKLTAQITASIYQLAAPSAGAATSAGGTS